MTNDNLLFDITDFDNFIIIMYRGAISPKTIHLYKEHFQVLLKISTQMADRKKHLPSSSFIITRTLHEHEKIMNQIQRID